MLPPGSANGTDLLSRCIPNGLTWSNRSRTSSNRRRRLEDRRAPAPLCRTGGPRWSERRRGPVRDARRARRARFPRARSGGRGLRCGRLLRRRALRRSAHSPLDDREGPRDGPQVHARVDGPAARAARREKRRADHHRRKSGTRAVLGPRPGSARARTAGGLRQGAPRQRRRSRGELDNCRLSTTCVSTRSVSPVPART
jgi:hypothetical protein